MGATATPVHPRGGRLRRALRALAWCLFAIVAALAVLYATRSVFLAPLLAARLGDELSRRTGAVVEVGSLGGNWWGDVELRDLHWTDGTSDATLTYAEVGWARAEYDLRALLRGDLAGLLALEASRVRVELRQASGARAPREQAGWSLPERLPRVSVRDLSAQLSLAAGRLDLVAADLDLDDPVGAAQSGRLRASRAGLRLADGRAAAEPLELELRWAAPRLEVASARLAGVERLSAAWCNLEDVARGDLSWGGELALLGGRLEHEASLRAGRLGLGLTLAGIRPQQALQLLWPGRKLPSAVLDGRAGLDIDLANPRALQASYDGELADVRWAGRVLERVEVRAEYAGGTLEVPRLLAEAGTDRLRVQDLSLPLGLGWSQTLGAARGSLELEASDLPALLQGVGQVGEFRGDVPAHALVLAARLEPEQLVFERGSLTLPDGTFQVRPGSLRWGRASMRETRIDAGLGFEFRELTTLGAVLALPRTWSGSLAGDIELQGTLAELVGHVELTGREVVAAGQPLGELRAKVDIDPREVRVAEFSSAGELGSLDGSGIWELPGGQLRDVQLSAAGPDLGSLLPGVFLAGAFDLRGRLSGALRDPRGDFDIEASGLRWSTAPTLPAQDLQAAGRLEDSRLVLERLEVEAGGYGLRARGALDHHEFGLPAALHLTELAARRGDRDLALVEPALVRLADGQVETGELRFRGSAGSLRAGFSLAGEDLWADVHGVELDLTSLLAPFVPEGFELSGLGCDVRYQRLGGATSVEGELLAERLRLAEGLPVLRGVARGGLFDGRAELSELVLDAGPGRRLELSGVAPLALAGANPLAAGFVGLRGRLELTRIQEFSWRRAGLALPLAGDLQLDFELGGDWHELTGFVDVEGERIALVSPRSGLELFGPAYLRGRLDFDPARVRLSQLEFRSPDQATLVGDALLLSGLRPGRWSGIDGLEFMDAELEADLHLEAADLSVLARLLPTVRRASGALAGALRVRGTPRRPKLDGELVLTGGELRLLGDVPALAMLEARLAITGDRLAIRSLTGEVGGGPFGCTGQVLWGGPEPEFDLALRGEEILLVQQPTLRLRSDLDLAVRGPVSALFVTGSLGLREGRYSRKIEFYSPETELRSVPATSVTLFSFPEGPLASMRFDVDIQSQEPFIVRNNLVDGTLLCKLNLGGSGNLPDLFGSFFVESARVRLPASTLEARSGTLVFDRDDPLVPRLDVRLSTRVRGYEVSVHLRGTSLEPEVQLSSSPPLSEEALLLLVLTGKPPESQWSGAGADTAVQNVAVFIGKDLLQGWFGGEDGGESLLDRVEWRSGVDVTQTGAETSEFSIRLSGPASGPGRTLVLRAEQDIYDHSNFGLRVTLRRK